MKSKISYVGKILKKFVVFSLRYLAFPLIIASVISASLVYYHPRAEDSLTPIIFLLVMAVSFLLEKFFPFEQKWNRPWKESIQDGGFFLLAQPIVAAAQLAASYLGVIIAVRATNNTDGLWFFSSQPVGVQIGVALLISEFPLYIFHRACHQSSGFLWRIHAIHHAPTRLYSLNFVRFHPLNSFLNTLFTLFPLVALGVSPEIIFVTAMIQKTHSLLSHTNFEFRLGPLNWIFSMAELHRWHHVREINKSNWNFGGTLIIWDVLFNTRRLPSKNFGSEEIGLHEPDAVATEFWPQIFGVFKRVKYSAVK